MPELTRELEIRLTRLEEQIKSAKFEWITESINNLTRTVDRMGLNVEQVIRQVELVTKGQEQLYKTHDALLKERAEYEREQAEDEKVLLNKRLEERTPANIAKRWLPMATLLTVIVAIFRILGSLFEVWLKSIQR